MNSQSFQQYVRIMLYSGFGALANFGITTPDGTKAMVASIVGFGATFIWTLYGTRLNGLLEQIKATTGVQAIELKVDPSVIPPSNVTQNTSPGIVATPSA